MSLGRRTYRLRSQRYTTYRDLGAYERSRERGIRGKTVHKRKKKKKKKKKKRTPLVKL